VIIGDEIHEITMGTTPVTYGKSGIDFVHTTPSAPLYTREKPMIPPTILWVVDTGRSRYVAVYNHVVDAARADNIPYIRT
jgi:hypothetical protein